MLPIRLSAVWLCLALIAGVPLSAQRRRVVPGGTAEPAPPAQTPALGLQLREEPGGLRVASVVPGTPAEEARLQAGDLIVSCMGQAVTTSLAFQRMVAVAHARGLEMVLDVERGGDRKTVRLRPVLIAVPAASSASVATQAAPAPGQGFNVLRYAALDPRSGEVMLWGDYDPAFATGPLDYMAWLHEALRNPSPSFTLEPTPAGREAGQALDRMIAGDAERLMRDPAYVQAYAQRLIQVLAVDLAQRPDGQRFARKCSEAFGLAPSEAVDILQPTRAMQARGQQGYMALVAKAMRHLGATAVADAIQSMLQGDTWGALDRLGVGEAARQAQADYKAGRLSEAQASNRIQALMWGAFLTNSGMAPSAVEAEKSRRGEAGFLTWAQERFTDWIASRVMKQMFHGMVLSEEALQRLYPRLGPVSVQPVCQDGLDPRSSLARLFFQADVSLKGILATSDLSARVPGHVGQAQALHDHLAKRGQGSSTGGLRGRTWLRPGAVALWVDPDARMVRFGEARVEVRTQVLEDRSGLGRTAQEGLDAYAVGLTSRYDAYARQVPDLHRMREAAKVLALARWARSRGLGLQVKAGPPANLPATVPQGFVQATFLVDGERFFLQPASIGGIDFSPQVGEAWVQARPDGQVVPSALGQLQASADLAGQAADRALAGDLEGARELAQRSADAMVGRIPGGLPPVPPAAATGAPVPMAQASTGILAAIQVAQAKLQAGGPGAEVAKVELQGLRDQAKLLARSPADAPQVVAQLRLSGGGAGVVAGGAVVAAPTPEPGATLTPEEQRILRTEVAAMRQDLCNIRIRIKRFNATIQMDQAQRQVWEAEVEQAQSRAFDRLKEMLVDQPAGVLGDRWNDAVGKGLRTAEERARLAKAAELLGEFQKASTFADFATWASQEEQGAEFVKGGLEQIWDLVKDDGEEYVRKLLRRKLGRPIPKGVLGLYDAGKNLVDTGFDLLAEGFAWARLRDLNRTAPLFLRSVQAMAERQAKVLDGIHARELKLGLPPGSTRQPCE